MFNPLIDKELEEYIDILMNKPEGKIGRKYLFDRGIKKDTAIHWKMGYCPVGYVPKAYQELINDGEFYEFWKKMWGRVVFPIYDQNGKLISISGRLIVKRPDKAPKYDHYSFPSRKVLFGLYQNKKNIQTENRLIITEGQIDVITAWQSGLKNVTSSFGAHCSLDHFAIAARYVTNLDVLYDGDHAGKVGTDAVKEFPTWGDLNVKLHLGLFPNGEDLDSWLRKNNPDKLYELMDKSKIDNLKNRIDKIINKRR